MISPDITFRSATSPYALLSSLDYVQTKEAGSVSLPIKEGENSDLLSFRIYNNWALNSNIASATNINVTTYDSSSIHSFSRLIVSQAWVHVYETGFGQSGSTPAVYNQFTGFDTPIGGHSVYVPEVGSDGTTSPLIAAGASNNGAGFIEYNTYMSVPAGSIYASYTFVVSLDYTWTS